MPAPNKLKLFEAHCECGTPVKQEGRSCHACANKARWADPAYRQRVGEAIAKGQRPYNISQRLQSYWNTLSPEQRRKRTSHLRRGPGPVPTLQSVLHKYLGPGWKLEYVIGTGKGGMTRGLPSRYYIDIAHPQKRVAVEVDGSSHHGKAKTVDEKKDRALRDLGWIVLRVRHRDIRYRLTDVVQQIHKAGAHAST